MCSTLQREVNNLEKDIDSLKLGYTITHEILLGIIAPSHAIEEVVVIGQPIPKCGVSCQQTIDNIINSYKDASSADIARAASNSLSQEEYKEETDEDRCSDEYKDYADRACRSAAGHSMMDDIMMCRFQYGPRDSAMYLAKEPVFLAALAKAAGKKALSWGGELFLNRFLLVTSLLKIH